MEKTLNRRKYERIIKDRKKMMPEAIL